MWCDNCESDPCACHRHLTVKAVREWALRECEGEHCTTMIRELPGQVSSRFCKWCQQRGMATEKQHLPAEWSQGLSLTKEQFGEDLYEVISLFSSREQIQYSYKLMCTKDGLSVEQRKRALGELVKREQELTRKIEALMPTLSNADARRLLDRYERKRMVVV